MKQRHPYEHDTEAGVSGDNYWPEEMAPQRFYTPAPRGFVAKIQKRLVYWEGLRKEQQG